MKSASKFILLLLLVTFIHYLAFAQVRKVDVIGITVSDMDRSVNFYSEVLGFRKISDHEFVGENYEKLQGLFGLRMRVVRMQLGEECIELTDYLTTGGRSIPEDAKSNDLYFQHIAIVVSDMEKAYQRLRAFNTAHVSSSPQTIPPSNPAAAGIKAFYFQDPDRHNLELIWFPKGKGQPKWQNGAGKLFLGIDHTAICISDTEKSHKFYNEILGIERKGDSWNKGIEQERLNNVEGASLHITGYRAQGGPGVEFLQYLQPGPGKSYPSDSRTNDIWHWQTTLVVEDAAVVYNKLKAENHKLVSKEIVERKQIDGKVSKSFVARDPDGHAILVVEQGK